MYDYLVTRPAYCYRTEKSTRLLARNDINMELRWVTSHCSGMSPSLSSLSFLSQRNKPGGRLARMRGGPRQIQQDSQRLGGRSSINLNTKRGEGYLTFYFCFSFKQILSELSGLTYMVCKPPKG